MKHPSVLQGLGAPVPSGRPGLGIALNEKIVARHAVNL